MRKKRTEIANPDYCNTFHITMRCIRKGYLLGDDLREKHRKRGKHGKQAKLGKRINGIALKRQQIVIDRIRALAAAFAVDVIRVSIMGNHLHLELRNRPDLVKLMSDEEVARRYLMIYPGYCQATSDARGTDPDMPTEEDVQKLAEDKKKIAEYRRVLSSISRFMQSLNFYVAKYFNLVDEKCGAFWESRYKLKLLLDDLSILLCAFYIDLNPIRANLHLTIETSEYTSAYYQIRAANLLRVDPEMDLSKLPNAFLTPVTISPNEQDRLKSSVTTRASDFGFTHMTSEEYLVALDLMGRILSNKHKGAIPDSVPPIFQRLNLNWDSVAKLVQSYEELFGFFVGTKESLDAKAKELKCGTLRCSAISKGRLPGGKTKKSDCGQ